jgi:hypothetical protein
VGTGWLRIWKLAVRDLDRRFPRQDDHPRTSAGTQCIVAASRAKRLYAVSLVTAEATVRAVLSGSPDRVSFVAMGDMASSEPMRMSYAQFTFGIGSKADQAMQTLFVA